MRLLFACMAALLAFFSVQRVSAKTSYPIQHVVLIWLKDAADFNFIVAEAKKLNTIPGLDQFKVAKVIKSQREVVEDSYDIALSMNLESLAALDEYLVHPIHQNFVAALKPKMAKLQVFDFNEQ